MADPQFENSFVKIDQNEIEECEREFARGGVTACQNFLRKKADEWKTVPLNAGIIGNSGTGKSTFINAVRGLTADDEGAAKVGEVETTTASKAYPHPDNPQLKFWDLPGVGTPQFPKETYLEDIGFANFDFFLIMSKDRFTENDLWIAQAIRDKQKQFYFIRTKIHNSIKDDKKSHPKSHDPEVLLVKIRENIRENLGNLYREDAIFLIDNHRPNSYDFNQLVQRLTDDLPSLKRGAFILSMTSLSEEMVKKKVEILRQEIWKVALLSATVAALPVPGLSFAVDTLSVLAQNRFYFKQLGLDDESLMKTAKVMSCDITELNQIVAESKTDFLTLQGLIASLQSLSMVGMSEAAEEFLHWIPFLGTLLAGGVSAYTMHRILNHILTKLEETALKVVNVAASSSAHMIDEDSDDE